ncbi:MAG: DNA-formamidopyrimidine glycosylase [Spirochaetes bacterium]|nr:DNA-formamidopyrimidine glycosylase [Spirochaetota bacterium]
MPELPDLVYIEKKLAPLIVNKKIVQTEIQYPLILRLLIDVDFAQSLIGQTFLSVTRKGPFLILKMDDYDLVIHFMLAGKLQFQQHGEKKVKKICFSLLLDSGDQLHYADDKHMGKVYLAKEDLYSQIPGLTDQGVDITCPEFIETTFLKLIEKKRQQVRVFLMDQKLLSAIGNAYADEILFHAKIHPKTLCSQLSLEEKKQLFLSIQVVIQEGIEEIEKANQGIEVKVRDHMKVRNRQNQDCPICGSTIRRASVLGFDTFFCPHCQPPKKPQFINW